MSLWFIVGVIVAVVVVIMVLVVVIVICCLPQGPAPREGVQTENEQAPLWGSEEATGDRTRALW